MRIRPGAFSWYQGDELVLTAVAQAKARMQPALTLLKKTLSRRMFALTTPARETSSAVSAGEYALYCIMLRDGMSRLRLGQETLSVLLHGTHAEFVHGSEDVCQSCLPSLFTYRAHMPPNSVASLRQWRMMNCKYAQSCRISIVSKAFKLTNTAWQGRFSAL